MRTVVALIAVVAACHSGESKGAPAPETASNAPREVTPTKGGPSIPDDKNDSSFNLQVAAPAPVKAGAETIAHVVVTPGTGYHVNQEFPTKLVLTPPDGVKIAKAEQHKEDATTFNNDKLQFDVAMTPDKAGTYKVAGTLKFAVCTESSCDPKKREIAFDLAAN
ncbi:MAG TPA: hypothetical protein VL463_20940 [Kofleriaceae bacterium]|jgi:hypothetical protein|nr:hypothetical protein [Kofleriaceae bacterium]